MSNSLLQYPPTHPYVQLRALQSKLLPLLTYPQLSASSTPATGATSSLRALAASPDASAILQDMISVVEHEQNKQHGVGKEIYDFKSGALLSLAHTTINSLLFYFYHDLSVIYLLRGDYPGTLQHVHQCLSYFEDDDFDEDDIDVDEDQLAEREEEEGTDSFTPALSKLQLQGTISRTHIIKKMLLTDPQPSLVDFASVLPATFALPYLQFPTVPIIRTPDQQHTKKGPDFESIPPVILAPDLPSTILYLGLLFRRFYSAFHCSVHVETGKIKAKQLELTMQSAKELLALIEENDQTREILLDELETFILTPPSVENQQQKLALPLKNLYSHFLNFYMMEVVVGYVQLKLNDINETKIKGNEAYMPLAKKSPNSSTSSPAKSASSSSSADSSPSPPPAVPTADYRRALDFYRHGIKLCKELIQFLETGSTTPSYAWFEVISAQALSENILIPPPPCPPAGSFPVQAQQLYSAPASSTPKTVRRTLQNGNSGSLNDNLATRGNYLLAGTTPQPFSILCLSFTMAQLYSNVAVTALKCPLTEFEQSQSTTTSSSTSSGGGSSAQNSPRRSGLPLATNPREVRAAFAQTNAERGIDLMEKLVRQIKAVQKTVATWDKKHEVANAGASATNGSSSAYSISNPNSKAHLNFEEPDSDEGPNIYVTNRVLFHLLPSFTALNTLHSKLYYRHGLAAFEWNTPALDQVAELSWKLSEEIMPDENVKREVDEKRRARKNQFLRGFGQGSQQQKRHSPHESTSSGMSLLDGPSSVVQVIDGFDQQPLLHHHHHHHHASSIGQNAAADQIYEGGETSSNANSIAILNPPSPSSHSQDSSLISATSIDSGTLSSTVVSTQEEVNQPD